ncbi:hypothetical protein MMC24_006844 [Lignoscripta atroalba]|nr:hypothetical protein [Lignoscripta atroalba]
MTKGFAGNIQEEMGDDRPIALRRKRRHSTALTNPHPRNHAEGDASATSPQQARVPHHVATTPTKPNPMKRVRFSDPGPESTTSPVSTGLTPFVKRTSLKVSVPLSSPRLLAKSPRRRLSLSLKPVTSPASSLPTPPLSGEIQFAPLRQILDDRVKRRLRRNHLSNELNQLEAERRTDAERKHEIQKLREELALARQLGNEVVGDTHDETGNAEKIRELEDLICKLKEEMRERSMTAEPCLPASGDDQVANSATVSIYHDGTADEDFMLVSSEDHQGSENATRQPTEASTQTSLDFSEIERLQGNIRLQASHLAGARLELEYICPGETSVGLATKNTDAKPILDALLDRLRGLKAQVLLSESALTTSQTQEANLRTQFNAVLQQLERARSRSEDLDTLNQNSASKLEDAEGKLKALEVDVSDKEQSISKLQRALESYRSEVANLEGLVARVEAEHQSAMTNLKGEMDEGVADLECHVVAETRGRREAETECDQQTLKIKQMETLIEELKGAINEKQCIIRGMEQDLDMVTSGREEEVGRLNVRIGDLTSNLEGAKADVEKLDAEKAFLMARVADEKRAGIDAVASMKAEMDRCLERVEKIRDTHMKDAQSRGAEVSEHKGLLTPVSAVRFKDAEKCEGFVEMGRGKGRRRRGIDSGIGILEEDDEDDEMLSMDV